MSANLQATPPKSRTPLSSRSLSRAAVLTAVLDPGRLPTPPAVALQVVNAASRPDCQPAEIVALISQDPALCAKLLKAVNSCLYGLSKPVSSLSRAVVVLGLSTVRSLILGLSLPAMRVGRSADDALKEYWLTSVSQGIIARELAALARFPNPEDDLIAGLLQDLGSILLSRTFPEEWKALVARAEDRNVVDLCDDERDVFGVSHAEVSAELLTGWKLPDDIVAPIRCHHQPQLLAGTPHGDRAELLWLAGHLARIETTVQNPETLTPVLKVAQGRFGLTRPKLAEFLHAVTPKVEEFARLMNQDIGQRPDFASVLMVGTEELVKLTVETSRTQLSGAMPAEAAQRGTPGSRIVAGVTPGPNETIRSRGPGMPEFRPEFITRLPPAGCRLGEYELRQQIGRGAMGVVFKAHEQTLDRFVAVKMLTPALSACPTARQRFSREARVAASIQHENVVAIYAVREALGTAYLSMEYVRGACLEDRVEQFGPLLLPQLISVCRQVASGLSAAHAKGIVHRDVKPANILLEEGTGRVKITDFGLARIANDRSLSTDGTLVGTPYYMAPEIVHGLPATSHSDLFSMGGVFYTLATAAPPFPGETVAAVLRGVCDRDPAPPRSLRSDLPVWFEELVLRLLQKSPPDRFASAAEVAGVLAEHTGD